MVTNAGAKPGDVLILTKPIGTGAINTAVKNGVAREAAVQAAIKAMTTSAAAASKAMVKAAGERVHRYDRIWFAGHAYEMAKASDVSLLIESEEVPLLPDVLELDPPGNADTRR